MEDPLFYSSVSLLTFLCFALYFKIKNHKEKLPPSPISLPIIGHLHLLKHPLHRTLSALSQKYGSVFALQLGSRRVLVVSSPAAVEECFTRNDILFANRPDFTQSKYLSYDNTTLGAAPYGDHWRTLRRLTNLEIFSSTRLNISCPIRVDEIKIMLSKLYTLSGHEVGLRSFFKELTLNITIRMISGKRYYGEDLSGLRNEEEAKVFRELIAELFEFTLASYPGDIWPILQWFDVQGYKKKAGKLATKIDLLFQGLIDEHRRNSRAEMGNKDSTMIGHLLSLQESQPQYYSDKVIKGLIMTMVLGGTDTSSVTLEWAMANLLNNPQVMNKARLEINSQIGLNQLLQESDITKLPYLKCIILETLRLYPAGPLLLPHRSSSPCTVSGYHIPNNTILLINAWAMQRDPKLWDSPTSFMPERFENRDSEAHKLMIAFGLGRRSCPGMGLANRVLSLTLGSLIHCFDWERVESDKEIDMAEGKGISMPKAEPLVAVCKARDTAKTLLHI